MPIASPAVLPPSPLRRPPINAADFAPQGTVSPDQALPIQGVDCLDEPERKRHRRAPVAPRVILQPRKLNTEPPLRLLLGCSRMSEKWTAALQCDAIEANNPELWRTLAAKHEGTASRLFWPTGVTDDIVVLKLSHVRLLLAQPLNDVHLAHLLYWMLVSPSGPQHLVAYTPRAKTRLQKFFDASNMKFAHQYLDRSKYHTAFDPYGKNFCMNDTTKVVVTAVLRALNEESAELPF